ncbi:MAG: 1-acyl-sn-glycerol-3-phosphate acyltransferase [Flavobacteriales bacterium]|nr:1-acyl-sn-glycerol-3-phosphate acyltransferase [Flavobacteriales bacterium]
MKFDFDIIRPYNDDEIRPAMERISNSPEFYLVMKWLLPELTKDEIKSKVDSINSTYEFQKEFMYVGIRKVVEKTITALTSSGFEKIDARGSYLYIANHRDILLDSGLLNVLLFEKKFDTTQITFGSNLMEGLMVDVGKANKMFTVFRGGTRKEMYENSLRLSAYIRNAITKLNDSVWIAQRAGRTKNGHDLTQTGVLKMFAQSGSNNFVACFNELNLTPISISYEYEPCDYFKAQELHLKQLNGNYNKQEDEDLVSLIKGVTDYKGRIHLAATNPIEEHELKVIDENNTTNNDKIKALCLLIDQRIYTNYKLWPTHFIATDILDSSSKNANEYTFEEKVKFEKIMALRLEKMIGNQIELRRIYLEIYATPVKVCANNTTTPLETTYATGKEI